MQKCMRIILLLLCVTIFAQIASAEHDDVVIPLQSPASFQECGQISVKSCKFLKGWSENGIEPDSADFEAHRQIFRVKAFGDSAKVFPVLPSGKCSGECLFSFLLRGTQPFSIQREFPSPRLIALEDGKNEPFFLLHSSTYVLQDSLQKIYLPLWLAHTLPHRVGCYKENLVSANYRNARWELNIRTNQGVYHEDKYENSIRYQFLYRCGDLLYLNNMYYRIESIDDSAICLAQLPHGFHFSEALPDEMLNAIMHYFGQKDWMVIDFWGTWCEPCIRALPKFHSLHIEYASMISFLSVCEDMPRNKDRAYKILSDNRITIPVISNELNGEKLTDRLSVTSFPTYLLVDKKGRVIIKANSYGKLVNTLAEWKYMF